MKRRDFISSHLGRNIGKARTTSSICGWALTSVRFDIRIQLSLIILSHPESTEDADDNEAMDLDDDQYPLLPEDVLEYRLRRRKAVLRQYMAAARRKYHSNPFYVRWMIIITQDSTILMVVFHGPTSPRIHPTISPKSQDLNWISNLRNRPT